MTDMSAVIVDGKALALSLEEGLRERVSALEEKGVIPHLAVVIAGDDPASHVYVRNKQRSCERCGILSTRIDLPSSATLKDILGVVADLNADASVHGILVQSPAPKGVDELVIASAILSSKDVDGFHPANLGKLVQGDASGLLPCTPSGVLMMLKESGARLSGAKAVVLGRSRIVGMPMALMLAQRGVDATVTIAHSRTEYAVVLCRDADIVVAAIGRPHTVKADWIKPGAFVVDVGISRAEDGGLAGDVDPGVGDIAGGMTPVPGGVGPMTIAMLMANTVSAAESA